LVNKSVGRTGATAVKTLENIGDLENCEMAVLTIRLLPFMIQQQQHDDSITQPD